MKHFIALLAVGLFATSVRAQDWVTKEFCSVTTPTIFPEIFEQFGLAALEGDARTIQNGTGRFWEITAPNGAVSHLWGTYHSSDLHILRLPASVKKKIEAAKVVAIEVDYTAPDREFFQQGQQYEGYYRDASDPWALLPVSPQTAYLPPEMSDWVNDRLSGLGWGEDAQLVLSLPGLAAILLSSPCDDFATGVFPIQDFLIQLLGTLAGAKVLSFEQPSDFFDDLKDRDDTAKALIATYASYLKPQTNNCGLSTNIKLYLEGRLGLMMAWDTSYVEATLGQGGREAVERTNDYLLSERNARFVEKLKGELPNGRIFTAVGAFHLPGDTGLIALLRDQDYTVTRVPLPGKAP